MTPMDTSYWISRWEQGDTGWHQSAVEPELIAAWSGLAPTRVFVPLCGKSLDLVWLANQGHEVIGLEASAYACESFFKENLLPFKKSSFGPFQKYTSANITLLQGDFFDIRTVNLNEHFGAIFRVYDRAALIALPFETRGQYAAQIKALLKASGLKEPKILQLVIERHPSDHEGPPHSVTEAELRSLYEPEMKVMLLKSERLSPHEKFKVETSQKVYELTK